MLRDIEIHIPVEFADGKILRPSAGGKTVEETDLSLNPRTYQAALDGDRGHAEIGDVHAATILARLLFVLRVDPLGESPGHRLRNGPG